MGVGKSTLKALGGTPLMRASLKGQLEVVRRLIDKGADVDAIKTKDGATALMWASQGGNLEIVRLLIEKGANVNAVKKEGATALMRAIQYNHLEIARLLIEKGANVNAAMTYNGITVLMWASTYGHLEIVRLLIEKGANVNAAMKGNRQTALMLASWKGHFEVVKELCERGADVNAAMTDGKTAMDVAKTPEIREYLLTVPEKLRPVDTSMWKGMTQSDIKRLNDIFGENATNFSSCPVCLAYVMRQDGCIYMYHNCSQGGYYHKHLYNMYKSERGNISWCTICGRICDDHRHYELGSAGGEIPELHSGIDPFAKDACTLAGGGGLNEKLARVRRLREYALELDDEIDKRRRIDVMNDLVEEVWNAPLSNKKDLIDKIKKEGKWNIPAERFRVNTPNKNVANVNAANIPFEGELPVKRKGFNNISLEDDVDLLVFKHKQKDGSMKEHGITEEGLQDFIKTISKEFGTDKFGYCFNNQCDAKLHPEEIKDHVTEAVYKDYKKKFNKKMAGQGGGGENVFREATDALCILPKKRGGATKRRGRGGRRTRRV
jgi:hypothetical protein